MLGDFAIFLFVFIDRVKFKLKSKW